MFKLLFLSVLVFCGSQYALAEDVRLDLRILVDITRDVREAQPDAQYLDALHLLVARLPENSEVGIWTYGKYVNYLVPQQPVNERWRDQAISKIQAIRAVAANRNIGSVLRKASYDLKLENPTPRSLLLISAGGVNVDDQPQNNDAERDRIKTELLPQLREAGYKIHTIALSKQADVGLLTTLAKETGGFSIELNAADEIYAALELMLERINQANSTPIQEQQFAIDAEVTELVALLRHGPGQAASMQSPSGRYITQRDASNDEKVQWIQGKQFTLIRVADPELGHWRLSDGLNTESKVLIKGGPKIVLRSLKDNYFAGQNLELDTALESVNEDAEVRVSAELGGAESFSYELTKQSDANNLYSGSINGFYQPGVYRVKVVAEALNYTRVLERPFQVYELLKIDIAKQQSDEGDSYLVSIQPMDEDLNVKQSTIVATITDATGEWRVSSVNFNDSKQWELLIKDDGKSSEYQIKLDFKGVTQSGRAVHFQPKPLLIEAPKTSLSSEDQLLIPYHKPTGEQVTKAASPSAVVSVKSKEKPLTLIIVAAASVSLGLLLLGFYFFKSVSKKEPVADADADAEESPPREVKEVTESEIKAEVSRASAPPVDAEIPVLEPVIEEESQSEEDLEVDVEIDFGKKTEDDESETKADGAETTSEPAAPRGEIEIELGLADEAVVEGTELASEWSQLDAQSNLEPTDDSIGADNSEVEIEFDFDDADTDNEKKSDT